MSDLETQKSILKIQNYLRGEELHSFFEIFFLLFEAKKSVLQLCVHGQCKLNM